MTGATRPTVDYCFSCLSPWAYLGHEAFVELAQRCGASVTVKPISLPAVFAQTGGLPLGQRHEARQAMRFVELQRWRDRRGRPLVLRPKHFPVDASLADRVVIAAAQRGFEALRLADAFFRLVWVEESDIADPDTLAERLNALGLPASDLLEDAESDAVSNAYRQNTDDAIAIGLVGSPGYVLNDEPFWGQDRLDLLDDALRSGRAAYTP